MIRLGGLGLPAGIEDPVELARAHRSFGYTAAYCPDIPLADQQRITETREAFEAADVMIAEVGAWSNLVSGDEAERKQNMDAARERLALADEIGALCAISFSGSIVSKRSHPAAQYADHQPDPSNLTKEGFDRCVETARYIIDGVKPKRAKWVFELMQFVYPDSVESTLDLVKAVDRPEFGVHIDPVNIILTPRQYFWNGVEIIDRCFELLGPMIVSCHAKDLTLRNELALHLDEVRLGLGNLDYTRYLTHLSKLGRDVPILLEHLPHAEYPAARDAIVSIGRAAGVEFRK